MSMLLTLTKAQAQEIVDLCKAVHEEGARVPVALLQRIEAVWPGTVPVEMLGGEL